MEKHTNHAILTYLRSAVLYDVKFYQSKKEFIADQSKHIAAGKYCNNHKAQGSN
jgi:hypothetical protein